MSSGPGSQTSSQALLSAPLASSVDDEACCELVGEHLRPGAVVFFITVTQSPSDRLSVYREYGPDDIDVQFELVAVDNQNTPTELDEASVREGSEELTITTVRNARDITRLGLAINKRLQDVANNRPVVVCFHSLTALLQFVDEDIAFRFIHTLNGVVESHDGSVHYHIDSNAHSPEVMGTFRPLFDTVVDGDELVRTKRDMEKIREVSDRPPAIELEPSTEPEADTRETNDISTSRSGATKSEPEEFETSDPITLDVEDLSGPIRSESDADPATTTDAGPIEGDTETAEASTTTPTSDTSSGTTSTGAETDQFTPGSEPDSESTPTRIEPESLSRQDKPLPELDSATIDSRPDAAVEYDSAIDAADARELIQTNTHRLAEGSHPLPEQPERHSTTTRDHLSQSIDQDDTLAEWQWVTDTADAEADVSTDGTADIQTWEWADRSGDTATDTDSGTQATPTASAIGDDTDTISDRTTTETRSAVAANETTTTTIDIGFLAQTLIGILLLVGGIALALQGESLLAGLGIVVTAFLPASVSLTLVGAGIGGIGALVLFLR
ncbi:MAG: hypothetical protein ABEH65_01905 [Halobacteriales archaeon]